MTTRRRISIYDYPEHLNPFSEMHISSREKKKILPEKFYKNNIWSTKLSKKLNRSVSWIEKSWFENGNDKEPLRNPINSEDNFHRNTANSEDKRGSTLEDSPRYATPEGDNENQQPRIIKRRKRPAPLPPIYDNVTSPNNATNGYLPQENGEKCEKMLDEKCEQQSYSMVNRPVSAEDISANCNNKNRQNSEVYIIENKSTENYNSSENRKNNSDNLGANNENTYDSDNSEIKNENTLQYKKECEINEDYINNEVKNENICTMEHEQKLSETSGKVTNNESYFENGSSIQFSSNENSEEFTKIEVLGGKNFPNENYDSSYSTDDKDKEKLFCTDQRIMEECDTDITADYEPDTNSPKTEKENQDINNNIKKNNISIASKKDEPSEIEDVKIQNTLSDKTAELVKEEITDKNVSVADIPNKSELAKPKLSNCIKETETNSIPAGNGNN